MYFCLLDEGNFAVMLANYFCYGSIGMLNTRSRVVDFEHFRHLIYASLTNSER